MAPSISVIVPVYNTPSEDLEKCVSDLMGQTFSDFEVLVIDDGSNEVCAKQIEKVCAGDDRFKVLHIEHAGVSAARNKGLERAIGKTIAFVDSDDYFAPWMLEDLWSAYTALGDVDAVCAYFETVQNGRFEFIRSANDFSVIAPEDMQVRALIGTIAGHEEKGYVSPGIYAVLSDANTAKAIRFPDDISYMEDTIWNLKLFLSARKVGLLNETVYAYKKNPYSASNTYSSDVAKRRIEALDQLSKTTPYSLNSWLSLRALATYFGCCKAIIWTEGEGSLPRRLQRARAMSRHQIWSLFKRRGVSNQWPVKEKVKRQVAKYGLAPFLVAIKGVAK